jgi:hypothetical protein
LIVLSFSSKSAIELVNLGSARIEKTLICSQYQPPWQCRIQICDELDIS